MKPDTLAPGATETLLLDVLGSDCSEPRVRSVALMLIAAGAAPNYRNADGSTPLTRAYNCPDIVDVLLKAGANHTDPAVRTPSPRPAPKTAPPMSNRNFRDCCRWPAASQGSRHCSSRRRPGNLTDGVV